MRDTFAVASRLVLALLGTALAVTPLRAQTQPPPYSVEQVVRLVESRLFSTERILELTRRSCLGFRVEDAIDRLQSAGAAPDLLEGLGGVCVRLPEVVSAIRLVPDELEIVEGDSAAVSAEPIGPDGQILTGKAVTWTSADTGVARVSVGGVVQARAPGQTTIEARAGDLRQEVTLRVLKRPQVVGAPSPPPDESSAPGKSPVTAALLGGLVPGGGQFYAGKGLEGAVVLTATAGAVLAGYLISSQDTAYVRRVITENCDAGPSCQFSVDPVVGIQERRHLALGAAIGGAFWLAGLVHGVLSARASDRPGGDTKESGVSGTEPGARVDLMPVDGWGLEGDRYEATLLRVRW